VVIVLVVVALLAPALTHWKPVVDQRPLTGVTFPRRAPVSSAAPTTPTTPPASPAPALTAGPPSLQGFSLGPVGAFGTGLGGAPTTSPAPLPPLTAPAQTSVPVAAKCQAAQLNAATTQLLTELDASLKVLPTATIETALGLATGCNNANPALLAVGALSELGDDLTIGFGEIPGASALKLPTIKPLELPAALLPLLASLKPVFSPICAAINSATNIVILIAPHYPQVIDGASALALFQAAVTCGELTGAS
jgi:hypothetical protein